MGLRTFSLVAVASCGYVLIAARVVGLDADPQAQDMGISPSKLLIPLSFASMFGGVCTLIGTSTNILVSSIATQHGQAPIVIPFFWSF
jgi:di/tricarboxylate transporter